MLEDQERLGKGLCQSIGVGHLRPVDLQIEAHSVTLQQRIAAPPRRGVQQVATRGSPKGSVTIPIQNLPDAPDMRKGMVGFKNLLHVRRGKIGAGNNGMGKAITIRQTLEPARLANGITRVPAVLHMDGFDQLDGCHVREIVGRKVIPPDCLDIPLELWRSIVVAQPGVIVSLDVLKMLMGIDEGLWTCHGCVSAACASSGRRDRRGSPRRPLPRIARGTVRSSTSGRSAWRPG